MRLAVLPEGRPIMGWLDFTSVKQATTPSLQTTTLTKHFVQKWTEHSNLNIKIWSFWGTFFQFSKKNVFYFTHALLDPYHLLRRNWSGQAYSAHKFHGETSTASDCQSNKANIINGDQYCERNSHRETLFIADENVQKGPSYIEKNKKDIETLLKRANKNERSLDQNSIRFVRFPQIKDRLIQLVYIARQSKMTVTLTILISKAFLIKEAMPESNSNEIEMKEIKGFFEFRKWAVGFVKRDGRRSFALHREGDSGEAS